MQGMKNRAFGLQFEQELQFICDRYAALGLAKIEKTPEPMKPIRALQQPGHFEAIFEKQAQPDYKGSIKGGLCVVFEAKHTTQEKFDIKGLTQEQKDQLEDYFNLGALAFVVIGFSDGSMYRVPWAKFRNIEDLLGHKHIKQTEAEAQGWRIKNHREGFPDILGADVEYGRG